MVDITISGRKVQLSDGLREHTTEKIGNALKVFDIKPMNCDVVLRVDKNPSNPDSQTCEVTVFVRNNVVRVVASTTDMYAAIDEAADKIARQLRKYKTKIVDRRQNRARVEPRPLSQDELAVLIESPSDEKGATGADGQAEKGTDTADDDLLVREKFVTLSPMTEEEALVQTDLLGHDFYMFTNATTGLTNVIYHRKNGGYGILKPRLEEEYDRN